VITWVHDLPTSIARFTGAAVMRSIAHASTTMVYASKDVQDANNKAFGLGDSFGKAVYYGLTLSQNKRRPIPTAPVGELKYL